VRPAYSRSRCPEVSRVYGRRSPGWASRWRAAPVGEAVTCQPTGAVTGKPSRKTMLFESVSSLIRNCLKGS